MIAAKTYVSTPAATRFPKSAAATQLGTHPLASLRSPERLDMRRSVESEAIEWPRELVAPGAIEEKIRQRAYELYEAPGRKRGEELKDWLQAEAEIRRRATGTSNVIPFRPAGK